MNTFSDGNILWMRRKAFCGEHMLIRIQGPAG